MPKVSEAHLESRRQQIVDAVVRCFAKSGIHGTSLDDIRLTVDLSRGAIYHYFKSKEDIIDALSSQTRALTLLASGAGSVPDATGQQH